MLNETEKQSIAKAIEIKKESFNKLNALNEEAKNIKKTISEKTKACVLAYTVDAEQVVDGVKIKLSNSQLRELFIDESCAVEKEELSNIELAIKKNLNEIAKAGTIRIRATEHFADGVGQGER